MYNEFLKKAERVKGRASEDYRHLHKCAEQGLHLPKTVSYVKERLRDAGYMPKTVEGGVVAEIGQGDRCILLRADMDGLKMDEESGLEYACSDGCMHACGHDMHTAMLLCAARLLKERERELRSRVRLCFQPGEETLEGAKRMIDGGLLSGVDCAVMLHVLTGGDFPTGTVIIPPAGVGASAADFFTVKIKGKGCHGSTPWLGCDPILPLAEIVSAVSALCQRELQPYGGDVLTVGRIEAGKSANVIPENARLWGTLRSYRDENREYLKKRLSETCESIAKAYRCTSEIEYLSGAPSFINSKDLVEKAMEVFGDSEIPPFNVPEGQRGGGSEDFAYVSRRVPSIMLCLSAGSSSEGYAEPLHSPRVRFNENAIPYGAAAYAAMGFFALQK